MKIILFIIGVLIYTYILMVISWTNGFMRSLKLMTKQGQKRSKYEKHIIKHVFKNKKGDVDPFVESIYMKQEMGQISDFYKQRISQLKNVVSKDVEVKKVKTKKNVRKQKK
tara:strand:+ start:23 stop:355 length:333 start_codon:yes stop_codon:yes gene_type:complete